MSFEDLEEKLYNSFEQNASYVVRGIKKCRKYETIRQINKNLSDQMSRGECIKHMFVGSCEIAKNESGYTAVLTCDLHIEKLVERCNDMELYCIYPECEFYCGNDGFCSVHSTRTNVSKRSIYSKQRNDEIRAIARNTRRVLKKMIRNPYPDKFTFEYGSADHDIVLTFRRISG